MVRDRDYPDLDSERRVSKRTPDLRTVSKQQSPSPDNSQVTQDIYIANRKVKSDNFSMEVLKGIGCFQIGRFPLMPFFKLPLFLNDSMC